MQQNNQWPDYGPRKRQRNLSTSKQDADGIGLIIFLVAFVVAMAFLIAYHS